MNNTTRLNAERASPSKAVPLEPLLIWV